MTLMFPPVENIDKVSFKSEMLVSNFSFIRTFSWNCSNILELNPDQEYRAALMLTSVLINTTLDKHLVDPPRSDLSIIIRLKKNYNKKNRSILVLTFIVVSWNYSYYVT